MYEEKLAFDENTKRTFDKNGYMHVSVSHISKEAVNPYYGRDIPGWQERRLRPGHVYYGYREGTALALGAHTFNGLPLLLGHHAESADNPQKEHRVGSLGTDATFSSPYLDNSIIVTDAAAIRAIETGEARELSAAYRYEPIWEPGVFNGQPYDFIMRNIEGNHVALVREGRAGHDVIVADETLNPNDNKESADMAKKAKDENLDQIKALMKDCGLAIDNEDVINAFRAGMKCGERAEDEDDTDEKKDDDKKAADRRFRGGRGACDEDDDEKKSDAEDEDDEEKKAEDEDDSDEKKDKAKDEDDDSKKDDAEDEDDEDEKKSEDEDDEDTDEKKDEAKQAMDEQIAELRKSITKSVSDAMTAKYKAAGECESILGRIKDPFAFDSADDIYKKALKALNVSVEGIHPSAYPAMLALAKRQGVQPTRSTVKLAQDSKDKSDAMLESIQKGLDSIRVQ